MMFRYGKIVESGHKNSRSDRFAEMSKQQQLIESKKLEIKAKFEARKRQEAIEVKGNTDSKSPDQKSCKDHKSSISSRMQSWKKDERWRKKNTSSENTESSSDLFSNDGSFLEKYKKITHNKPSSSVRSDQLEPAYTTRVATPVGIIDKKLSDYSYHSHTDPKIPSKSFDATAKFADFNDGIPFPPPPLNLHPADGAVNICTPPPPQSLYSITSQALSSSVGPLTSVPATPPTAPTIHTSLSAVPASVSLLPAVPSSATSLQTVSLIQVPVSVPASSVILSCPLETTLVTSEPVVHLPVVQSTLSHGSISVPLQTVPLQTAVIPAQIQITSQNSVPQSSVQAVQINQSSTNVILSQTLQPPSILLSSECVADGQRQLDTAALPNTNVPPPSLLAMQFPLSSGAAANLPPVHLPPPNYPHVAPSPVAARHTESSPINFNHNNRSLSYEQSLLTSLSDNQSENRRAVSAPDENELREMESMASLVASCGDDMEDILAAKYCYDEKFWYLRQKDNPRYMIFRSMVDRKRSEICKDNSSALKAEESSRDGLRECCNLSASLADEDDSDAEDTDAKRKRKRKRKSRWAPESTKPDGAPDPTFCGPGSATPSVGVAAAPNVSQKKLYGVTGPLISQVTRTDPALLQYALKSFGTLNLSEDDWKKAEDHYKINLLYQDMLKKRQELERLQAAGKHKYAYDSDEDTDGGTWEHKLRQQEMVATQRWADELTERAKGKHHIGDFLPPDELERFLEKYNALKQGREPDISDYKEFKLKEDNIGFQMLQKLGWSEGQGLGSDGSGMVNPVNKAPSYATSHGLGIDKPDDVSQEDDEYDAYRKRMMLAYRFRPNPLNNPRRPYY